MPQPTRRTFLKSSTLAAGILAMNSPLILRNSRAASTDANSKLNLALVGCGGQGRGDMKNTLNCGCNLAALCDVDESQMDKAKEEAGKMGHKSPKLYTDYRKLLENAASFDAVIVATPDHWHAPLAKAFMQAGKHVYCEKPLTHSIAEARELRQIAKSSKVVTQMGNQGSASTSHRRCVEVIQAGALGQIRNIYIWGIGCTANEGNAKGEDPIPAGLNWDFWCGPSAMRPWKKDTYHPYKWRGWYDFGNSGLADFCCHAINLPMRALKLAYPEKLVVNQKDGKTPAGKASVEYHFGARPDLDPVTIHWLGTGRPGDEIIGDLKAVYKDKMPGGMMIVGEKGSIYTSYWNTNGLLKLQGEPRLTDVTHHAGTKAIPQTLPRMENHQAEFVSACRGQGQTYSPFEIGGHLTEIGLSGVAAIRIGHSMTWDGDKMESPDSPEVAKIVKTEWRSKWMI